MKQNYFSFTKVLLVATICVTLSKFVTSQDWYDSNWQYRRPILISNPGGTVLTDYQVLVTLNNSFDFTKAKIDGSDIRITGANGTTLVHFWIEKWDAAGLQAAIWIKIPDLPVSGAIIYMYYGNSAAIKASSGSATFEFFDDFESPIITEYGYFNISETPTTLLNVSQGWKLALLIRLAWLN